MDQNNDIEYIEEFNEKEIDKIIGYSDDIDIIDNSKKSYYDYIVSIILYPLFVIRSSI